MNLFATKKKKKRSAKFGVGPVQLRFSMKSFSLTGKKLDYVQTKQEVLLKINFSINFIYLNSSLYLLTYLSLSGCTKDDKSSVIR